MIFIKEVDGFLIYQGVNGTLRVSLPSDINSPHKHKLLHHSNIEKAIDEIKMPNFRISQ